MWPMTPESEHAATVPPPTAKPDRTAEIEAELKLIEQHSRRWLGERATAIEARITKIRAML